MSLFTAIPIAGLVGMLAGAGGAGYLVYKYEQGQIAQLELADARADVEAQDTARKKQAAADAISLASAVKSAEARQKIVVQTVKLVQKVPVYVTRKIDARFPLPCGAIRLYNASTEGRDPDRVSYPTTQPDDAPCPTKLSDAVRVIVANNGLAATTRQQLIDLQDWIKTEQTSVQH